LKNLSTKTCPVCNRPFEWRKKWKNCWDDVIYCSKRCSNRKSKRWNKYQLFFRINFLGKVQS